VYLRLRLKTTSFIRFPSSTTGTLVTIRKSRLLRLKLPASYFDVPCVLRGKLSNHNFAERRMKITLILSNMFLACSIHAAAPTITQLQTEITQLQQEVAQLRASSVQALAPFVKVDFGTENGVVGPNIVFSGANIHVVSGSGNTWDNFNPTGLGNLIIGYDEGYIEQIPNRTGVHNLIVGRYHEFTRLAFGGIVSGEQNILNGAEEALIGGASNTTNTSFGVIVGGVGNSTIFGSPTSPNGSYAQVVVGGAQNSTAGAVSCIFGGTGNVQNADFGVILGTNTLALP
jgi:hypothetical protein